MNIVIVGAGLAAANTIDELRTRGHQGTITLIGAETYLPYERPPLSKGFLLGDTPQSDLFVHHQGWYDDRDVHLMLGTPVTGLDVAQRQVKVADEVISYDALLLATGAASRHLPAVDASELHHGYLRDLADTQRIKTKLAGQVLIIGGGWIGLEVASAARTLGAEVIVVEPNPLPLVGILGTELGTMFADLHRSHGVDLRLGTSITGINRRDIELSDGDRLTPDFVLVSIGAVPNDSLAREAGLQVDHGVLVDARLQTSDPHVFAAGDVANHDHPLLGRLRVEHWDNSIQQGRHVAGSMLGEHEPYSNQPYFYTDQYDLGMEYLGHAKGDDEVILRGDLDHQKVTALWVSHDTVVAGMHTNEWDAMPHIRRLVGQPVNPDLRDTSIPLAEL